jgi:hypothetical protein
MLGLVRLSTVGDRRGRDAYPDGDRERRARAINPTRSSGICGRSAVSMSESE